MDAKDAKTLPSYTSCTKSLATPPAKIVLDSLIPKQTPKPATSGISETKSKPEVVLPTNEPDLLKKLDPPATQAQPNSQQPAKPRTTPLIQEIHPPAANTPPVTTTTSAPLTITTAPSNPTNPTTDGQQQQQQTCTCTNTWTQGSSLVLEFSLPHTTSMKTVHLDVSCTSVRLIDLSDRVLCVQALERSVVPDSAQARWSKKSRVLCVSCILAPVSS